MTTSTPLIVTDFLVSRVCRYAPTLHKVGAIYLTKKGVKMILAIGNSSDREFEAYNLIQSATRAKGGEIVIFCQDKCLDGESIIFRSKDCICEHVIKIDGIEYRLSDFDSVLYMHPQINKSLLRYEPQSHANFIERQFRELRKSLWILMSDKKWIDDPWRIQRAENKIFQLVSASSVGLNIPDTAVTSDPEEVKKFYADHKGRIISKIVVPAPILDHVIYTNLVTEEQMKGIESVKMCPSIFQEKVSKSYELRITVVGDKLFAAKIDSQGDEETRIDWRKKPILNDHAVRFSSYELPDGVTRKIFQFMEKMGLRFGCIDMIVTPNGKYVFLEINPNGQWYFVQLKTKMDIASAIVDLVL